MIAMFHSLPKQLTLKLPNLLQQVTMAALLAISVTAKAESAVKVYTYVGIDGNEHRIQAHFPTNHKPTDKRPCFIFFHGGGWKSGDLKQGQVLCDYLAERGIVAVTANYSMHRRTEKGKLDLGNPDKINSGPALADGESRKRICVIDGKTVVRWVKQNASTLGVNPEKLIVSGASAGAHIGVLQMMDDKFNNPADPKHIDTKVQAFVLLAAAFTLPERDKKPEVNVFQHVKKPFPPTLIIVGETDRWAIPTRELARQLNDQPGNEIEFWMAPDMGHMFMRSGNWYTPTKLLIDRFLREHKFLTGTPTLEPVQEQLRRIELSKSAQ